LKTAEDAKKCQKRLYLDMYFLLGEIPFNIKTYIYVKNIVSYLKI